MPTLGEIPNVSLQPATTSGAYDTQIYKNVSDLVYEAVGDVIQYSSEITENKYFPDSPTIPRSTVELIGNVQLPDIPGYAVGETPSIVAPSGGLQQASYNALSAVVGNFQFPSVGYPSYLDPTAVPGEPSFATPTPDLLYPEASFIPVDNSAGLVTIATPNVQVGDAPTFLPVKLLTYDPQYLPKLDAYIPTIPDAPTVDPLQDPNPLAPLSGEVIEAIRGTLQQTDLLQIQNLIQYLGTVDIKRERLAEERKLFAEFAARGFSAELGALYGAVEDLDYSSTVRYLDVHDKAREELFEAGRQKLLTAIEQAIALETANFARHLSYAEKLLDVFETNVQIHTGIFNVVVEMYNLQVQAIGVLVDAYNTYINTAISQYSADLEEASQVRGLIDTNAARLTAYEAQVRTEGVRADIYSTDVKQRTLPLDEFSTYVQGLIENVKIVKLNVDAYRSAIGSAVESTKIDRAKAQEYAARVGATGSLGQVYAANWDVYGVALSTVNGVNEAAQRYNSAALQALNSEIGVFRAALGQQNSYLQGASQYLSSYNSQLGDWTRAVGSMAQFAASKNDAIVDLDEARKNIELTQADMISLQASLDAQRDVAQGSIDAGLLSANATTLSGLAQAAYSIRSVSASLGSSSSDGQSKGFTTSASETTTYSYGETKTRSQTLSA